ncbi:lanthionine synthetase C family protein [Streptomyces sp. NPDC059477]|uniref:lanthionine synthetase C family protein n=1 Tax=Streptomyces sp. NPDC059477 TaxID=3346847 RepID=UPI0036BCB367
MTNVKATLAALAPVVGPTATRAMAVAREVARRLADPATVRRTTDASCGPDGWSPGSLGDGHAGVALLYTGNAPACDARSTAHAHLLAAARHRTGTDGGLFAGDTGIAFAALVAAHGGDAYRALRQTLDDTAVRAVAALTVAARSRREVGGTDLISGLTGLGRHLLAAGRHDAVRHILTTLIDVARPHRVHGRRVPGWWIAGPPTWDGPQNPFTRGHFNLGLAHGVAGQLALLSAATRAEVTVPDQHRTATTIAEWLIDQLRYDERGPRWPAYLPFTTGEDIGPARAAWCYGTPGVARALHLAGRAFDRPDWSALAVAALNALLTRPPADWLIGDASLCHGAAGLLRITHRMAQDTADPALTAALPSLTERVLAHYTPETPFGFRYTDSKGTTAQDRPGFLEGAAGVALTLTAVTTSPPSDPTPWDTCLALV